MKTLRLILGDQLNSNHSWFKQVDDDVVYVLFEMRQETDYVKHHIQKIVGFFSAMRAFAQSLEAQGHPLFIIGSMMTIIPNHSLKIYLNSYKNIQSKNLNTNYLMNTD